MSRVLALMALVIAGCSASKHAQHPSPPIVDVGAAVRIATGNPVQAETAFGGKRLRFEGIVADIGSYDVTITDSSSFQRCSVLWGSIFCSGHGARTYQIRRSYVVLEPSDPTVSHGRLVCAFDDSMYALAGQYVRGDAGSIEGVVVKADNDPSAGAVLRAALCSP